MRIIAGQYRGRSLKRPPEAHTRPTTQKVRGAVFNILTSKFQDLLTGVVVDAFAGSGGFGLEALSRGAHYAYFCENHPQVLRVLKQNLSFLDPSTYSLAPVSFHHLNIQKPITLLYLDPPFEQKNFYRQTFEKCLPFFDDTTLIITESYAHEPVELPLLKMDERIYGRILVQFFLWKKE